MMVAEIRDVEFIGVSTTIAVQVSTVLCQVVLRTTPVDSPIVVGTELIFASHLASSALPATFVHIVGHLYIASPVVEAADDTDTRDRNNVPCHLNEVDIHLIEAGWLCLIGEALARIVTILFTVNDEGTLGTRRILSPVTIPVVGIGLELEAAIKPIEALVDTVLLRTAELVSL